MLCLHKGWRNESEGRFGFRYWFSFVCRFVRCVTCYGFLARWHLTISWLRREYGVTRFPAAFIDHSAGSTPIELDIVPLNEIDWENHIRITLIILLRKSLLLFKQAVELAVLEDG